MCGVVGFTTSGLPRDERLALIRRGLRSIAHRGPDETGIYDSAALTLGTVRLAIVDVPLGKQPMISADDRYVVGFNGEVFNYIELREELIAQGERFRTNSDTEVLLLSLAHWGAAALDRINGQLGFAFYDRLTNELILGRDPHGERPMYYTRCGGRLYYASEIKGLFAFPAVARELDVAAVRRSMRWWSPMPGETCFAGIDVVPPGHYLRVNASGATLVRYYHEDALHPVDPPGTFDEATEQVRGALAESIRLRLRGDFPIGAYVSGGIDSSIVAVTMAEAIPGTLRTFALNVVDAPVDEAPYQEALVAYLGSDHSVIDVTAQEVRARFPSMVHQCEQPLVFTSPAAYSLLAQEVAGTGVRIMLGGEGADETFSGYDLSKEALVLQQLADGGSRADALARLSGYFDDVLHSDATSAKHILDFYDRQDPERLVFGAHLRRFVTPPIDTLFAEPEDGALDQDLRALAERLRQHFPGFDRMHLSDRSLLLDMHLFLIGYGMTCLGDRAGTGYGVEGRYPFLDRDVVRCAAALPVNWKISEQGQEKYVLRKAFEKTLPTRITQRPKYGMRIPGAPALRPGAGEDWVEDVLSPGSLAQSALLSPTAVTRLADQVRACGTAGPEYPFDHLYNQTLSVLLMERTLVREFVVPDVDTDRIMRKQVDGDRDLPAPVPTRRSGSWTTF